MGRKRENKLTLYRRGRVWWVAAKHPHTGQTLAMSLRETNAAIAAARHMQLQERWERGEAIFPTIPAAAATDPGRKGPGLAEAAEQFLAFRNGRVAPHTLINDKCRLQRFAAAFPVMAVRTLTKKQAEDWLSGILAKGTRRTHNQYLSIARKFLTWCQSHGLRMDNPLGHLKPLPVADEEIEFLTLAQRAKVLEAARRTRYGAMVATAVYAGLRLGELRRLRWSDVDLKARTLIVQKSKIGARRQVPLPKALCIILRRAKTEGGRMKDEGRLCFPVHVPKCLPAAYRKEHGEDAIEGNLKEYMAGLTEKAGCQVNWLICRHTFGSLLAQKGVSLLKIAKWMGHRKPETTVKHYATLAPGYDKDVEV